ncbi:MAG: hypothetical protein H7Z72_26105 [Bacteroidetes bacterium]|nr:hypothetical protein [Fibrella sp.]
MAKQSPYDPDAVDPAAYSHDPYQHGDSDFGDPSEGVGTNTFKDSTSGIDMDAENMQMTKATREANRHEGDVDSPEGESLGTTQEWDVNPEAIQTDAPKGKIMSDEAAEKLNQISDNPSDEALFKRADATYLEPTDDPNTGYDPHNKGYDSAPGK